MTVVDPPGSDSLDDVAITGEPMLELLNGFIRELREAGLSLDAIKEMLNHPSGSTQGLAEVLRITEELRAPWTDDNATRMSEAAVLRAYERRCAVCKLPFAELLDAAHIVGASVLKNAANALEIVCRRGPSAGANTIAML